MTVPSSSHSEGAAQHGARPGSSTKLRCSLHRSHRFDRFQRLQSLHVCELLGSGQLRHVHPARMDAVPVQKGERVKRGTKD